MEEKPIEIKQVSERETWVGKNRLYLGEDNIIYQTLIGKQDEKTVLAIYEANDRLANTVEGKVNVLVDLNKAGQASSGARKKGQEMLEDKIFAKVALFGLHPVARVVASFFMGISRKKDLRFFKTREEALAWLKQ